MHPEDRVFRGDATGLVTIRTCMAIQKSRRELFECGHPLWLLGQTVLQQMSFALFAPSFSRRLREREQTALSIPLAVGKANPQVHLPTFLIVLLQSDAHRRTSFAAAFAPCRSSHD